MGSMNTSSVRGHASAVLLISLFATLSLPVSGAQQPANTSAAGARTEQHKREYRQAMESADQKIAGEVKAHSELMKNLEYLTTEIGPRLTGSPQMQAASKWTLQRFHDYGIDAHLETTHIT